MYLFALFVVEIQEVLCSAEKKKPNFSKKIQRLQVKKNV